MESTKRVYIRLPEEYKEFLKSGEWVSWRTEKKNEIKKKDFQSHFYLY